MIRNSVMASITVCLLAILPQACRESETENIGSHAATATSLPMSNPLTSVSVVALPKYAVPTIVLTEDERKVIRKLRMKLWWNTTSHLKGALESIDKYASVPVSVDWRALNGIGVSENDHYGFCTCNTSSQAVPPLLLSLEGFCMDISGNPRVSLPVVYYIKGDTVYITHAQAAPDSGVITMSQAWRLASDATILTPKERRIIEKMRTVLKHPDFNNHPLQDFLDYFRDATGVKLDVDWASLKNIRIQRDTPVELKLENVNALTCLRKAFNNFESMQCYIKDDAIVIRSAEVPEKEEDVISMPQARGLVCGPDVQFQEERKVIRKMQNSMEEFYPAEPSQTTATTLKRIVLYAAEKYGLQFYVHADSLSTAGVPSLPFDAYDFEVPFDKSCVSVMDCLDKAIGYLNTLKDINTPIFYYIKGNVIFITNADLMNEMEDVITMDVARRLAGDPTTLAAEKRQVLQKLATPLKNIDGNGVELYDAIDSLRQAAQINIYVDWPALQAAGALPPGTGKSRLVKIKMVDITPMAFLDRMLEDINASAGIEIPLVYCLDDDVVTITNKKAMEYLEDVDTVAGIHRLAMYFAQRRELPASSPTGGLGSGTK